MNFKKRGIAILLSMVAVMPTMSNAATIGSDTNIKLTPASAGMAGVGYVRPQDSAAAVYGNPASLTQLDGNTEFTFGANYLNVFNEASADGSVVPAFSGDIEMEHYLLPSIAFRQRLSDRLVIGSGLQVISGLGSDYRSSSVLQPTVTYMTFGANLAAAYQLNEATSIGASVTAAYGLLEIGLVSNTGMQEEVGFRAGVGVNHNFGPVMVGLNYNSELALDFDNVVRTAPGQMSTFELEQPREIILGVATTDELWSKLLVEANFIYKNWDDAKAYQDIWRDTYTLQLGAQYSLTEKLKLRAGFSHTTDLLKENGLGNSISGLTTIDVGGVAAPINPQLLQFMQATLADPAWNNNITVGLGYDFNDNMRVDLHAGYAFGPDRTLGANKIKVGLYSVGAGLSWKF